MKKQTLVLAAAFAACGVARADSHLEARPGPDGQLIVESVDTQQVMTIGRDEKGKRKVIIVVDGRRYEGEVAAVVPTPPAKAK